MAGVHADRLMPPAWVVLVTVATGLIWLLVQLKEIVFLLVMGYAIAYVINPWVNRLGRHNISRGMAVVVIVSLFALTIVALALGAMPTLVREYKVLVTNFPHYLEEAKDKIDGLAGLILPKLQGVGENAKNIGPLDLIPSVGPETMPRIMKAFGGALLSGYSITLTLANLILLPFIVYYLSVDFPELHRKVLMFVPITMRRKAAKVAKEIDEYVSAFVSGQIHVGFLLFILYCVGLGALGIELWFLLAVISGFGSIVPYAGFFVGIILSSIMTLVTYGDFSHLLMVWCVYGVIQFLEGTFITPRIVGSKVGLSPLVVIIALFCGGKLFGVLGILLAIPGAAVIRVLGKNFYEWMALRV